MADPLSQLSNEMAPPASGGRFFDPAPGQNVLSRYGNARMLAGDLEYANQLEGSFRRNRIDAMREEQLRRRMEYDAQAAQREQALWGRDDQKYAAEQEANDLAAQIAEDLVSMDESDPDYELKIDGLIASAPPEVVQNPTLKALLARKAGRANAKAEARVADQEKQEKYDLYMRGLRDNALLAGVSEEDIDSAWDDEAGNFDPVKVLELTGKAKREAEMAPKLEKEREAELAKAEKRLVEDAENSVKVDREAFPSRIDLFVAREKKKNETEEQLKDRLPDDFRAAKQWDDNLEENEFEAAREMTEDAYVNKVRGIDDRAKEKRRNLWKVANRVSPTTQTETETQTEETVTPEATTFTETGERIVTEELPEEVKALPDYVKAAYQSAPGEFQIMDGKPYIVRDGKRYPILPKK